MISCRLYTQELVNNICIVYNIVLQITYAAE